MDTLESVEVKNPGVQKGVNILFLYTSNLYD